MILNFPHQARAAGSPVQRIPDSQQHACAVGSPLPIPKPQFVDALRRQKLFALRIMLLVFRLAML
jgi:hypothetical protein